MAAKLVEVTGVGQVALYKRKGVRGVRMSITHDGTVRITLPSWAPYKLGVEFARNKAEWISQKRVVKEPIQNGDRIGKAHRIIFKLNAKQDLPSSRVKGTDVTVIISPTSAIESSVVQFAAQKAAIRALKKEAEQLLPQRLATLADQYGFKYEDVSIKQLRSRWGSCNEKQFIVLNCYLMQLPWYLIDYVLLHELVHTKILRHGDTFWKELGKYVKNLPAIRKEMKLYKPSLEPVKNIINTENPGLIKPVLVVTS